MSSSPSRSPTPPPAIELQEILLRVPCGSSEATASVSGCDTESEHEPSTLCLTQLQEVQPQQQAPSTAQLNFSELQASSLQTQIGTMKPDNAHPTALFLQIGEETFKWHVKSSIGSENESVENLSSVFSWQLPES